jgi:phage FluMu protein Com
MTKTIEATLFCETCNKKFIEHLEFASDIDWTCPRCKDEDETFLMDIIDTEEKEVEEDNENADKYSSTRPKSWG